MLRAKADLSRENAYIWMLIYTVSIMKRVVNYNDSYFDQRLENIGTANVEFWSILTSFDQQHPEADLTVIFNACLSQVKGRYVEVLEFRCSRKEWEDKAQKIYRRYYHPVSLKFLDNLLRKPTDEEIHSVGCVF